MALLILVGKSYSNLLLALIFAFSFFLIGFFTSLSSFIVRYPHWKEALLYGLALMAFSFFLMLHHGAAISFFIGLQLTVSGLSCVGVARKARRMENGTSIFQLIQPGDVLLSYVPLSENTGGASRDETAQENTVPLIVHIWTPEESAATQPVPRPIINRYIAAVDTNGVISTGHAALEVPEKLYLSLYPAEEIDRSPSEFLRTLRATRDNDVKGRFLNDYGSEAASWCESTRKITFKKFNYHKLETFWHSYRLDNTYNLTYRNCSSTVAYALEAALDGVLENNKFSYLFQSLVVPELWIAAQVRKRAQMMAWTPGLVMDYTRALYAIVQPDSRPWFRRLPGLMGKRVK